MEDCVGMPSLPDLLDELDTEVDVDSLEQLTQSLLQDIARDLEAAAQKTSDEVSVRLFSTNGRCACPLLAIQIDFFFIISSLI